MRIHRAPWGKTLIWTSSIMVVLSVANVVGMSFLPASVPGWTVELARWTLPAVVLGCLPFMIRSYQVTDGAILIRRPFWTTRLDLAALKSAEVVPDAMRKSLRTCGNGGVFSFTGWYWSKALGGFRAFVTDLHRTVVLRFDNRTVVVSPDAPEEFARELEEGNPNAATGDRRYR